MAAILDLGQLLIREPSGSSRNFDQGVVSGFIVAREVGLGLSFGFLFLFVWRAVAECPWNERPRSLAQSISSPAPSLPHSASWTRWGFLGAALKWFTLTLVIVIPLLQILWRLISSQRQYGSIYIADSTLEIVASAIFALKIVLNVLVSPSVSWWAPFRRYLGLVLALIITGAMGVGNLVSFAFSETVLGRFLRAISIYILLLWNLITTFHRPSISRQPLDDQEAPSNQQEKSKEGASHAKDMRPSSLQARAPSIVTLGQVVQSPKENRPPLRITTASRLSMIVNRNETLAEITRTISSRSSRKSPVTPMTPKRPKRPDLRFDIVTPTLPSTTENPDQDSPTTGISLSYYTMDTSTPGVPVIREPPVNPTKPSVYQAGEQSNVEYMSQTSLIAQPPSHTASLSSFDELMRQQNELDKSIANLRLLSVDNTNLPPQGSVPVPAPESSPIMGDTATSAKSRPQSTLRTESLSPHSEFSFSAFPVPPPRPESIRVSRFTNPTIRRLPQPPDQASNLVVPMLSVPESPSQASMAERMISGGTQYDVTSFIDNLAEPGTYVRASIDEGLLPVSERTIDHGRARTERELRPPSIVANGSSSVIHLKPMLLPVVSSERRAVPLPSLRPIRDTPHPLQTGQRDSTTSLKPFLLGTSAISIPPSLPSSTMVPLGSRKGSRVTRVLAHKSRISTPRLNISDVLDEEAPETYERPRPPPVLIGLPERPKA